MLVAGSIIAIALIVLMLVLGVRSIVAEDARFGFRTFSVNIQYEIDYHWRLVDGGRTRYVPGDDLKGIAWDYLRRGAHATNYDIGAVREWVCAYAAHVYREHAFDGVEAFEATVAYRENGVGVGDVVVFRYPAEEGSRCA